MPDPAEMLESGRDALCGISDLLGSVNQGNLHLVDPGNLYALLELVRRQLDEASLAMAAQKKSA